MAEHSILDLIIVGAGPAGISAAFAATRLGLSYLVLERDTIASTIASYPLGKTIFSDGCDVEIVPDTLRSASPKPTREEVLNYYRRFAEDENRLNIHTHESVTAIRPGNPLGVTTVRAEYRSRAVIVATGVGDANHLDVPGETPDRVSYLYQEIELFRDRPVLVVGGGNSAGEAALDLLEAGAHVTLSLRRPSFERTGASRGAALQPPVRTPLERAINLARLRVLFDSHVREILSTSAKLVVSGEEVEVACDRVFALLGTTPQQRLMARAGAIVEPDGIVRYDRTTYETTVPNLFVVGHVTREINLLNAVRTPPQIVSTVASRLSEKNAAVSHEAIGTCGAEFSLHRSVDVREEACLNAFVSAARVRRALTDALKVEGALGIAIAAAGTGELLAVASQTSEIDVARAAGENSAVLRARAMVPNPPGDTVVEDVVITLGNQYHILRPLAVDTDLYLFFLIDRARGNLGFARYALCRAESHIAANAVELPPNTIVSPDVLRENRLPPGQSPTLKWPVVQFGETPAFDRESWSCRIYGLVERECQWDYDQMTAFPRVAVLADFHCVTRWSRLDNLWEGVSASDLLAHTRPTATARFAIIHAEGGWTTSLPLSEISSEDSVFAYRHNGAPLDREHGFPLRLVVPRLYAWKSAKWVRALEIVEHDHVGFWERAGYHALGDPWQEQRRA
jgi:thioredoxin reductase (NADPH)